MPSTNQNLVDAEWESIAPCHHPYPITYILGVCQSRTKKWMLHPRYQRYDYTWTDENRSLYIDSIEKNIAQASTITLSVKMIDNVEHTYILDGGHRIDTIKRFHNDEFRDMRNRLYSEFNGDTKLTFDGRLLTVITYRNLTDEQEDLLFMRINRNLSLSQGETINAYRSTPICKVTHECSEIYKPIMCDKYGLSACVGDRMEEKAYMFVLCVNFLLGKVSIFEKPGTKVLSMIEKYSHIKTPTPEILGKLKKNLKQLFSCIDVRMTKKFKFYDLLVAQWLIINSPSDVPAYKYFMEMVYMKDSVWYDPWKDAVKNDTTITHSRVHGLDHKNIQARVKFFKDSFVNRRIV